MLSLRNNLPLNHPSLPVLGYKIFSRGSWGWVLTLPNSINFSSGANSRTRHRQKRERNSWTNNKYLICYLITLSNFQLTCHKQCEILFIYIRLYRPSQFTNSQILIHFFLTCLWEYNKNFIFFKKTLKN